MKILLLGGSGLVGSAIRARIFAYSKSNSNYSNTSITDALECVSPSHSECDVLNELQLSNFIKMVNPDVVINATGYTKVDDAERDPTNAITLNHTAVKNLVFALKDSNIPLVHFSTDYVFDGKKASGYIESDLPCPLSEYGKSKAAGEEELLHSAHGQINYYLVRTSWVYGPGGKNFVDTMLSLAEKGQEVIQVVDDQFGCPTFTLDLADAVLALIKTQKYGIYHLANEGATSWYTFAVEIFHQLGIPQKVVPITTTELARPAPRPKYSILLNTRAPKLRAWKDALTAYLMDKQIIL